MMATAGIIFHLRVCTKTSGSVKHQMERKREVWRVYDVGIDDLTMRSHAPICSSKAAKHPHAYPLSAHHHARCDIITRLRSPDMHTDAQHAS